MACLEPNAAACVLRGTDAHESDVLGVAVGRENGFHASALIPEWLALTMTVCRGVRGATTVDTDDRDEILKATTQLLALMIRRNDIQTSDVASAIFTVTKDLQSEFPALAARQLGWLEVPLLCSYEVSVERSLPRCIRILLHWNTDRSQSEIHHVYIRDAVKLRPDLNVVPSVDFEELEQWIQEHLRDDC